MHLLLRVSESRSDLVLRGHFHTTPSTSARRSPGAGPDPPVHTGGRTAVTDTQWHSVVVEQCGDLGMQAGVELAGEEPSDVDKVA